MKIYNLGNDFALAERLKKVNADNKVVEAAEPSAEYKEDKEDTETVPVPDTPTKTNKKKKAQASSQV